MCKRQKFTVFHNNWLINAKSDEGVKFVSFEAICPLHIPNRTFIFHFRHLKVTSNSVIAIQILPEEESLL